MEKKKCSVPGCTQKRHCRTVCKKHYYRLLRYGSPTGGTRFNDVRNKNNTCSVKDCNRPAFQKGLCSKHISRYWRHGDPNTVLRDQSGLARRCPHEYNIWCKMRYRCFSRNNPDYPNYGGRGITICKRWLGVYGFRHFIEDMGERPKGAYGKTAKYSLDRIDVNGDYCPENCRWATVHQQAGNKRRSSHVPGVYFDARAAGYVASITILGVRKSKRFKLYDDAVKQRLAWEQEKLCLGK